jgi:hypothetical protein
MVESLLTVDELEQLDEAAQGVVLAALLAGGDGGALERIAEGPRCDEALQAFKRLEPEQRRQAVTALARRLLSPLPRHLERVHPSWIQALLEREPAPVVQVVVRSLPPALKQMLVLPALTSAPPRASGAIQAQILRSVLGQLCSMPPPPTDSRSDEAVPLRYEDLLGWSLSRLEAALEGLGALALASSLKIDPTLRERLAGLPSRTAALLRRALARPLSLSPRELPVRSGALQGQGQPLLRLGIQLLGRACPDAGEVRRQLAQRLPREQGQALLEPEERAEESSAALEDPLDPELLLRLFGEADALARGEEAVPK